MVAIMPVGLQFVVDTFMGYYWMVLLSSFSYIAGLGFLSMLTPPDLAAATATCSAYDPECIGRGQKILFFTALALIAVGFSGHLVSVPQFMADQDSHSNRRDSSLRHLVISFMVIHVPKAGAFAIYYVKPWSMRYGIPAICTLLATLIFLTGSCSYRTFRPYGSPLTVLFRVFVASASKIFQKHPRDPSHLYERRGDYYLIPHTRRLRCLDKAAIILATQPLQQQENNSWRLCRVTEVEETKSVLCMIPICMTLILIGVVSSIGTSFCIEQATHMNHEVGRITVPLPMLVWFYTLAKQLFGKLNFHIAELTRNWNCRIAESSIDSFLVKQVPPSIDQCMVRFCVAFLGVGSIGGVLSVYVVGEISGQGGKPSWFQDTLNKSRLDHYYWTMAA
ncbi:unnamed protein product, partial [Prunus brigantina]